MKKLLAALLAMTMVVSLVACGPKEEETKAPETSKQEAENNEGEDTPSDEAVQLSFAWWGNQTRNERTEAMLDLYTEEHPNVTFNRLPYVWDDYWTAMAVAAASNDLPDIMQHDYAYIEQFVGTDDLVDLTPYTETGAMDISQISDGVVQSGKVGDGIYAICAGVNAPAMVYNKTLTDSLDIEVPANITYDQFAEISKEIYEKAGVKTNYGYGKSENSVTYHVRAEGHEAFFEKGGLAYGDASVLTNWFEFLGKGQEEGWMIDTAIAAENSTALEQNPLVYFTTPETQSWMVICFSNQIEQYQASASAIDVELGITTWPSSAPEKSNYLKSSQFYSVTTDTVAEEIAVDVVNCFVNGVDYNNILLAERGIPAPANVAEAIAPNLTEANQAVVAYLNDVVTPNCSPIFPPLPDGYNEVVTIIGDTIEQFLYGAIDAETAAQKIWDEGNAAMAAQ